MKHSLPALLSTALAAVAVLAPAGSAVADPIDAAVATLRHSPVYVGADAPTIEQSRLGGTTLSGIKIAIVPPGGPEPVAVAESLGQRLDSNDSPLTVVVFEGSSYGVASTAYCGTGKLLETVVASHRRQLRTSDDVTATVADFAGRLRNAPRDTNGCSGSSAGTTSFGDTSSGGGGISTGLIVVIVIIAALLVGLALLLARRSRRKRQTLADARAQVEPYLERLAHDVETIDPDGNRTAQQAMTDAAERLRSASRHMAAAQTEAQVAQAGRTVLEGLHATRTARTALGLPPGPELPPVAASQAPQLDRPQQVTVQGQTFQGYPAYAPGAPYYYPGGYGVPGGWYGFPFWETLLVGSMIGGFGGWGWGWGWGGYDAGFDSGYNTGYDTGYNAGEIAADQNAYDGGADYSGADWGDSGGGGDWGGDGGSGDWGGGDSGGGGGDWGSSGDGGGSW